MAEIEIDEAPIRRHVPDVFEVMDDDWDVGLALLDVRAPAIAQANVELPSSVVRRVRLLRSSCLQKIERGRRIGHDMDTPFWREYASAVVWLDAALSRVKERP